MLFLMDILDIHTFPPVFPRFAPGNAETGALAVIVGKEGASFRLSNLRHRYPPSETFGGPAETNKVMMRSSDPQGMKR